MELVFLGTGTSSGIPAIGCDCQVCTSPDPRDNRLRTSAALQFRDAQGSDRTILIDAGPDLRQQSLRAKLVRCDAIFITHHHVDHIWGLDEVRRFNALQQAPISIYADQHTMESMKRVYQHIFEKERNVNDSFVATLMPWTLSNADISSGREVNLYGLKVTPIRLLHGRQPILGYRFDATPELMETPGASELLPLAYCTDVSGIPPESWGLLEGLKTLVLDALRIRRHPTHFTLDEAIAVSERVRPGSTYFVHMSHDLQHEYVQSQLPDSMWLAYDGLRLGVIP